MSTLSHQNRPQAATGSNLEELKQCQSRIYQLTTDKTQLEVKILHLEEKLRIQEERTKALEKQKYEMDAALKFKKFQNEELVRQNQEVKCNLEKVTAKYKKSFDINFDFY